jgi:site-specific DNA-cytosine methylase
MSLFGGAGGMDVGLAMSQFRTCWMIDDSAMSCCTFAAHHPATKVTQLLAGEALLNRTSLSTMPTLDEVEGIAMGPPCQPFSKIVSAVAAFV